MHNRLLIISAISYFMLLWSSCAHGQNFPHLQTFGFDYISFDDDLKQAKWAAKHHDWIVGISPERRRGPRFEPIPLRASVYDAIKKANPSTKIVAYFAYHSNAPQDMNWMEDWCRQNGHDPEKLYYHYYTDTKVRISGDEFVMVPGYGGGSAKKLEEARARVHWNGGWVAINPSSHTWRLASQALVKQIIRVQDDAHGQYVDGLFLDSFDGLIEKGYWSSQLENTIELHDTNTDQASKNSDVDLVYQKVQKDLIDSKMELEKALRTETGNNEFVVMVNAGEPDYPYYWLASSYMEKYRRQLDAMALEIFVNQSYHSTPYIQRLKQTYDDLEHGRKIWMRSETGATRNQRDIPLAFTQYILASHYLVNHKNAVFMYHEGSSANYGGYPSDSLYQTHWHSNMEVNIGEPIHRKNTDYWGKNGTDRFFIFAKDSNSTVLGREYTNALVLAKFGPHNGWSGVGKNRKTYTLPEKFHTLNSDNSLGSLVDSISLGDGEGAILLRPSAVGGSDKVLK
jgi:hypothetical protein